MWYVEPRENFFNLIGIVRSQVFVADYERSDLILREECLPLRIVITEHFLGSGNGRGIELGHPHRICTRRNWRTFDAPPFLGSGGQQKRDCLAYLIVAGQPDVSGVRVDPLQHFARWQIPQATYSGRLFRKLQELVVVQLEAEDSVFRGSEGTHQRQVFCKREIPAIVHSPSGVLVLLFQRVEPLPWMAREPRGTQTFAKQPTAGSGIRADDVRLPRRGWPRRSRGRSGSA